jgi:alpha-galactosidase
MNTNFSFQLKLRGDDFNGRFTNGISMANSQSVRRCNKTLEDDTKTIYEAKDYRVNNITS